jgi:excisionase family DNA binding protein
LEACKARLGDESLPIANAEPPDLHGLADDLQSAWNAPGVSTRARQRLVRTLIKDIVVDVDEAARDVLLTIHWQGGQHSQLRVRKPRSGEHGCTTSDEALNVIRSMAGRWSDSDIAATLNRMGVRTGHGKTWTAHRVSSIRRVNDIHAYASAEKDGEWLTMTEAAKKLGVTNHAIRKLIKEKVLPAEQVVPRAPYQIRAADIERDDVIDAVNNRRRKRPCRDARQMALSINSST